MFEIRKTTLSLFLVLIMHNVMGSDLSSLDKSSKCMAATESASVIQGLLTYVTAKSVNRQCYSDVLKIKTGIQNRETWALKVLDASGRKTSGFIVGNNQWLGSEFTCKSVKTPILVGTSNKIKQISRVQDLLHTTAPIDVTFKMVYATHQSPFQINLGVFEEHILHIGLCLPVSCSKEDTLNLTNLYFENEFINDDFLIKPEVLLIKDLKIRNGFYRKPTVLITGAIFLLSIGMAAIAYMSGDEAVEEDRKSSGFISFFSIKKNIDWVYDTRQFSQSVSIIHGLKTLFTLTVLVGHVVLFTSFATNNRYETYHYSEEIISLCAAKMALTVDVFLTISGFLLAHQFLGNQDNMAKIKSNNFGKNVKYYAKIIMNRYFRLLPLYMLTLLLVDVMAMLIEDISYFRVDEFIKTDCQKHWCKHLFLMQNWFDSKNICFNWSWYIATEVQVFAIFLLILFIYAKNKANGKLVFTIFTCGASLLTLYATIFNDFQPTADIVVSTMPELYNSPVARISPYFPGVVAGWVYTEYKNNPILVLSNLKKMLYIITFLTFVSLNLVNEEQSVLISSLWYFSTRWLLSIAVALLIVVDALGCQFSCTKFLSSKLFFHFGKIEYAFFILNPLIIISLSAFSGTSMFLNLTMEIIMVAATSVLTYIGALFVTVLIDRPCRVLIHKLS